MMAPVKKGLKAPSAYYIRPVCLAGFFFPWIEWR